MTQKELMRLKTEADKMGQWAVYLLTETEYWTPQALDELTEEKLQEFQTRQAQWLMQHEREYPDSGAAEVLREEITWQIKQNEDCLTEDEAFEMECLRMDGMPIEELPTQLAAFRAEQEKQTAEESEDWLNAEDEEM